MPEHVAPDQQKYWNENLDPQNLGRQPSFNWRRELSFHHTPDQKFALSHLRPLPGKWVIDIGAGIGMNAMHMAAEGATVIAVDIAQDRLAALRANYTQLQSNIRCTGNLLLVKATAEALPFKDSTIAGAYSKSVLIHTQLEQSISEIHRVLQPDGVGTFIEPLTLNPFVNLYRRTLAPKIWQSIARYFGQAEFELFRKSFSHIETRAFYLTAFLAFAWQFGIRVPALFRISLVPLQLLDSALMQIPALARRAWFAVIVVRK